MKVKLLVIILAIVFAFGLSFVSMADDDDDDDQGNYYSQQNDDDDDEQDTALAGGSMAQIRGDGPHCYFFFKFPDGTFAQYMVNSSEQEELVEKVVDAEEQYVEYEGGEIRFMVCGNGDTACIESPTATPPATADECTGEADNIIQFIRDRRKARKGRNPQTGAPIKIK